MNEIVSKKDPAILAIEIRSLQQQAQVVVLSYAIEIGRRLCEAKATVPHGQWGQWLETEVNFSQSSAQNYMKIYERYGSEQISLFGDAKTETLGSLPYTKALKLLAVPEDEMDTFLEEHDVEGMSTRELEQAIRERDETKKALEEEKNRTEDLTNEAEYLRKAAETAQADLETAEAEADAAKQEAEQLRSELEELRSKPIDVAVQAPTEEMLEEIRAAEQQKFQQERETLEKKLADAEAKAEKQKAKAEQMKADAAKIAEKTKADMQKGMDSAQSAKETAEAEKAAAEARAAELEKKLKLADSDTAAFQVYFQSVQETCNRMIGLIKKAQPEQREKFKKAMAALIGSVSDALNT